MVTQYKRIVKGETAKFVYCWVLFLILLLNIGVLINYTEEMNLIFGMLIGIGVFISDATFIYLTYLLIKELKVVYIKI